MSLNKTPLRIATRASALALWQAEHVAARLRAVHADLQVELVPMTTRGDQILDRPLAEIGGKGLFLKELEVAMLEGRADIAVHSLKDVPMELEPGFALGAVLERADAADAFISNRYRGIADLPPGARVMLTVGHKDLGIFLAREDCSFVVRTIEPMGYDLPEHAEALVSRPPYFVGAETELLKSQAITHLITKNSGGVQTEAKLRAAQQLRIAVVMIARPELPPAHEVQTVGRAIAALRLGRV